MTALIATIKVTQKHISMHHLLALGQVLNTEYVDDDAPEPPLPKFTGPTQIFIGEIYGRRVMVKAKNPSHAAEKLLGGQPHGMFGSTGEPDKLGFTGHGKQCYIYREPVDFIE